MYKDKKLFGESSTYVRPEVTITDIVQNKEDIKEQLMNFEEVNPKDISNININEVVKYLTYDKVNKKELFRFGGVVRKIYDEYIVLATIFGKFFNVKRYTYDDEKNVLHVTRFFVKKRDQKEKEKEKEKPRTNTRLSTTMNTILDDDNTYKKKYKELKEKYYKLKESKSKLNVPISKISLNDDHTIKKLNDIIEKQKKELMSIKKKISQKT